MVYETRKVPDSWQEASITLKPKEGKDLNSPQSYRPISHLNVDYKILPLAFASRLMKVSQDIVGSDQLGFLKGRHSSDSIRCVIKL